MILLLSMRLERAYRLAAPLSGAVVVAAGDRRVARAFIRRAIACLTYLGRNALIILPMHVLAAALAIHAFTQMSSLSNPLLADAMQKLLADLILLASIELLSRCPLIMPRKSASPIAAVPQG